MQAAQAIVIPGLVVKCEQDGVLFLATPRTYISRADFRDIEKIGRKFIECPRCHRRYFSDGDANWIADRKLTIVQRP
jgi:hypothetical protein